MIDLYALFKGRLCCFPKDPLEDVETWSESVDKVLSCKGESLLKFCMNVIVTFRCALTEVCDFQPDR